MLNHSRTHYTKKEMKLIKNNALSHQEVADRIGRSRQAIYCKRWQLEQNKTFKSVMPSKQVEKHVISSPIKQVKNSVNKIVLGNVTVDLISKTLTVYF
jgi:hypothetical protein